MDIRVQSSLHHSALARSNSVNAGDVGVLNGSAVSAEPARLISLAGWAVLALSAERQEHELK